MKVSGIEIIQNQSENGEQALFVVDQGYVCHLIRHNLEYVAISNLITLIKGTANKIFQTVSNIVNKQHCHTVYTCVCCIR
jgi:hypothetical protein